jgi:hypothetical protein
MRAIYSAVHQRHESGANLAKRWQGKDGAVVVPVGFWFTCVAVQRESVAITLLYNETHVLVGVAVQCSDSVTAQSHYESVAHRLDYHGNQFAIGA